MERETNDGFHWMMNKQQLKEHELMNNEEEGTD